nr:hypothetical protein Iba_chr04bCG12090 [Ipomoea batatas]
MNPKSGNLICFSGLKYSQITEESQIRPSTPAFLVKYAWCGCSFGLRSVLANQLLLQQINRRFVLATDFLILFFLLSFSLVISIKGHVLYSLSR